MMESISEFEKYYLELLSYKDLDEESISFWQSLVSKAIDYTSIRAIWSIYTTAQKSEKDNGRIIAHDAFVVNFHCYIRYLESQGINIELCKSLDDDRKAIGDLANYIVFREAIKNR